MKRTLATLLAVLVAAPAFAQEQPISTTEPTPFEVVRLGDSSMECEALVREINALNQQLMAVQQDLMTASQDMSRDAMAAAGRRPGGGLAMGLGNVAASFIPGGGLIMGAVQAADQQAAASSMRDRQAAREQRMQALSDGTARLGPMSQRVAHLSEIAREQSC